MLETMTSVFTFLLSLILTFYFGVPKLHDMATAETLKAEHSKLLSCLLVAECCSATCLQSLYSRHPSWYGGAATGSLHYSRITSHWPPLVLKFKSARPFQEMCFLHKDESICQNVVCWFGTVIHKVVQVVHLRVRRCFQDLTRERMHMPWRSPLFACLDFLQDVLLAAPALQFLDQMGHTTPKVLADQLCKAIGWKGFLLTVALIDTISFSFSARPNYEFSSHLAQMQKESRQASFMDISHVLLCCSSRDHLTFVGMQARIQQGCRDASKDSARVSGCKQGFSKGTTRLVSHIMRA